MRNQEEQNPSLSGGVRVLKASDDDLEGVSQRNGKDEFRWVTDLDELIFGSMFSF
jgi:hypothetical protein